MFPTAVYNTIAPSAFGSKTGVKVITFEASAEACGLNLTGFLNFKEGDGVGSLSYLIINSKI